MDPTPRRQPAIGQVAFDRATGELAGPGGREQLDPKVAAVFALLLDHRGEVVPRETLFEAVWRDRIVTDDVLSRCVYQLRRQLGVAGGEAYRELIETLPKRGYRLREFAGDAAAGAGERIADPRAESGSNAADTHALDPDHDWSRRRWVWIGVGGFAAVLLMATIAARWPEAGDVRVAPAAPAAPVAASAATSTTASTPAAADIPRNTIAVLPFADLSEGRDQAFLAHGISEELLGLLARRTELAVTARTSSFASGHDGLDVVEIGRRLRVAHVVEGSVRRAGDRLRINATLVDARDGRRVWSESYDREFRDVLQLENEIAESVAGTLAAKITADAVDTHAGDPIAHEAFLHARFLFNRRGEGDLEAAERYLKRALELDPTHARAWAALAAVYSHSTDRRRVGELQRDAALRALELAPDLPEAHLRAGSYYGSQGDAVSMRRHFMRARELDPDNPLLLGMQAGGAFWRGNPGLAVEFQQRAVRADPLSAIAHNNLAAYLGAAGRFEEARAAYATAADLNPSDATRNAENLLFLALMEGRHDLAWTQAQALDAGHARDAGFAVLAERNGRRDEGEAALARLRAAAPTDPVAAARAAEALAQRGDVTGALAMVALIAEPVRPALGCPRYEANSIAVTSGLLKDVRADPRWPAVRATLCVEN